MKAFNRFKSQLIILIISLLLQSNLLVAQTEPVSKKDFLVFGGVSFNSIGFPFLSKPNHLGFNAGVDCQINKSDTKVLYLTSSINFINFRYIQNLFYLNVGIEYQHKFRNFFINGALGVNTYLGFPYGQEFEFVDGEYKATNKVYLRFGPDIKLGIGYDFTHFKLGINYGISLQYPFMPGIIPILPNGIATVKFSYRIKK